MHFPVVLVRHVHSSRPAVGLSLRVYAWLFIANRNNVEAAAENPLIQAPKASIVPTASDLLNFLCDMSYSTWLQHVYWATASDYKYMLQLNL
ncbi:hypothetical protein EJB05_42500, partial [Eragrostis curvula]